MGMKIKRLEIEGYKSLKHVVWEPGDLNILIGPNGSGKSNLLRLLEMLSASAKGELSKFIQDDNGIQSILWDGQANLALIRLTTACFAEEFKEGETFDYELALSRLGNTFKHIIDNENMLFSRLGEVIGFKDELPFIEGLAFDQADLPDFTFETILSAVEIKHPKSITRSFKKSLGNWSIYHDFRTDHDAKIRGPMITLHEKALSSNGQNLINVLHTLYTGDKDFEQEIDTAMQAAFGSDYKKLLFQPSADRYIEMKVRWKNLDRDQPAYMLSDGILRYLFLITALANPDPPSLIAIDEPEIGLHPSMFPLIAEYADEASENTQVVISTHSPKFLNAIQEVNPNVTVTVMEWIDGETDLRTLSDEKLKYWLEKYKLGEMFRSGGLEAI